MDVVIRLGSILEAEVEALVNPANSAGTMRGGLSAVLLKAAGEQIETEALEHAPVQIGQACVTSAGSLPFRGLIHTPTVVQPTDPSNPDAIYDAMSAALKAANEQGYESVAIPGLGTGVGQVRPDQAARAMVAAIRDAEEGSVRVLLLVDVDQAIVDAWQYEWNQGERIN